ncbi:MAG TPA: hypothetical protein VGL27_00040 [Negativicutes bacterium]|jgi:hypothetical protein
MIKKEEKQPQGKLVGQALDENTTIFRHTAGMANRFTSHMDFNFTRTISCAEYGGAAVGECFAASFKMVDGDFSSYTRAWHDMAQRVETKAWDCLSKRHNVSAREAFMRTGVPRSSTLPQKTHSTELHMSMKEAASGREQSFPIP